MTSTNLLPEPEQRHRAEVAEFIAGTGKHPACYIRNDHRDMSTSDLHIAGFLAERFDLLHLFDHALVSIAELDDAWHKYNQAFCAIKGEQKHQQEAAFFRLLCDAVLAHTEEAILAQAYFNEHAAGVA